MACGEHGGHLLKREGLAVPRRKVRKTPLYTHPFQQVLAANELWCADFKGWFRTLDNQRIDPLTITDMVSRYLLRCQVVEKTNTGQVQAIFEAAFREMVCWPPSAPTTDRLLPAKPLLACLCWHCSE